MPDRVISVPQAAQIATRIKNKFDNVNGRLTQQGNDLEPYNYSVTTNLFMSRYAKSGYYLKNDGALGSNANQGVTDYFPVNEGDTLYATRTKNNAREEIPSVNGPKICFYNGAKEYISGSYTENSHATAPANAAFARFSCYLLSTMNMLMLSTAVNGLMTSDYVIGKTISDDYKDAKVNLTNKVDDASGAIANNLFVNQTDDLSESMEWTSGYVNMGGTAKASDSYKYSEKIEVNPGDNVSTAGIFRYVTAYIGETANINSGAENVSTFTVPSNISAVVVSVANATNSISHTHKVEAEDLAERVGVIEEKIDGVQLFSNKTVVSTETASLTSGQMLTACSNIDNKKDDIITFYANLDASSFESVTVGHGYNISYGASVTVDATKITTSYGTTADYYHANHGLNIDKFLMVEIIHKDDNRASIRITTASGSYEVAASSVAWGGCRGDVFALSTNSTLSDVKLSCTFADFERDIFVFGDSYVGLGDNSRWSTVLISNGYKNLMIDGYGGRNSANAIISFRQIIAMAKPKYIVWALGMNDADSSAINASYKECLDEVLATCELYGIVPIVATIPNVPERLHTYKNTYAKSLEQENKCRVVDFAKAVGAETAGSYWYNWGNDPSEPGATAMLSSDKVHPSTYGAKALYARFVIDVPEIANLK